MQVFEVMAVRNDEKGKPKEILIPPYTMLAVSEEAAKMTTIIGNTGIFESVDMNEVSILVRPFK
jgi:hypothetical protein